MEEPVNSHYIDPDFSFFVNDDFLSREEDSLFSKYQLQEQSLLLQSEEEKMMMTTMMMMSNNFGVLDEIDDRFDNPGSPLLETCLEEIAKLGDQANVRTSNVKLASQGIIERNDKGFEFSLLSLELLNTYNNGSRRLTVETRNEASEAEAEAKRLSTVEVLRIGGERFVRSASLAVGDITSCTSNPYRSAFSGFSNEETRDIELVELLLACAEKFQYNQLERARKMLGQCYLLCKKTGNPIERVVFYFCEALQKKIDIETGNFEKWGSNTEKNFDLDEEMMRLNATSYAFHQSVPFSQLSVFPGIQAIFERVEDSKRIHVIDIGIRTGLQWAVLMQALSSSPHRESPLELLKITALGTRKRDLIEETGKRLASFAQTLNIPFSFKVVMVSDMSQLTQELFEAHPDETIVVYASFILRTMLVDPRQLECVMRVVTRLRPCVMVVTEVEANHNSTSFVSRFVEALFFYGAYFDCVETFMSGENEGNRIVSESEYFGHGIRSIVSREGSERKIRNVGVDVWRAFFARFGLVDVELSSSSLYQVKLILNKFRCEDSCVVDSNGNCLIFRWKGTPIQSLSVWEFRV